VPVTSTSQIYWRSRTDQMIRPSAQQLVHPAHAAASRVQLVPHTAAPPDDPMAISASASVDSPQPPPAQAVSSTSAQPRRVKKLPAASSVSHGAAPMVLSATASPDQSPPSRAMTPSGDRSHLSSALRPRRGLAPYRAPTSSYPQVSLTPNSASDTVRPQRQRRSGRTAERSLGPCWASSQSG
jgi:hypothetical protein